MKDRNELKQDAVLNSLRIGVSGLLLAATKQGLFIGSTEEVMGFLGIVMGTVNVIDLTKNVCELKQKTYTLKK